MSNIELLRSYLQDKHNSLSSCNHCRDFGFPCLNCADYKYKYKYGPGRYECSRCSIYNSTK